MHEGKFRRINRIFSKDGKTLVVAMDHAAYMPDVIRGLENPSHVISKVMNSGADALMTTIGTIRECINEIRSSAVIMSMESYSKDIEEVIIQAIRYDVDMIKVMVYPFSNADPENVRNFQKLATYADKWNIPIMAEVFPGGYNASPQLRTLSKLSAAVRVSAEMGADLIKTFYIEDESNPNGFREVIKNALVPVVVLGGEKSDNHRRLLEKVKRSMDSGAAGVAIGRNIWGYPKPDIITMAISEIIHKGDSIENALKLLS